jgi:hypothetical protein
MHSRTVRLPSRHIVLSSLELAVNCKPYSFILLVLTVSNTELATEYKFLSFIHTSTIPIIPTKSNAHGT